MEEIIGIIVDFTIIYGYVLIDLRSDILRYVRWCTYIHMLIYINMIMVFIYNYNIEKGFIILSICPT
jgi:hypothetical protein